MDYNLSRAPSSVQSAGIEFIGKILETEQKAGRLADEAREKSENMRSGIDASAEGLRREYRMRAEERVKKMREQNRVIAEEQIAALDETFKRDYERMETAFEKNQDEWTEQLFRIIIKRD